MCMSQYIQRFGKLAPWSVTAPARFEVKYMNKCMSQSNWTECMFTENLIGDNYTVY